MTKLGNDLTTSSGITHGGIGAKQRFHNQILKHFIESLIANIKDRLPDTGIFSDFEVLNPSKLPDTVEAAAESHYGEATVQKLGDHYGRGDDTSAISNSDYLSGLT